MADDLMAFLRARLDEDELWAIEGSRDDDRFIPTGAHWHWQCTKHDTAAVPNPGQSEFLETGSCDCFTFSLRSIEEFQSKGSTDLALPQFALHYIDEIRSAVAGHIARQAPARVTAEVNAKRRILDLHSPVTLHGGAGAKYFDTTTVCRSCEPPQFPEHAFPCPTLRLLALPHHEHPDYLPEWAPDARGSTT